LQWGHRESSLSRQIGRSGSRLEAIMNVLTGIPEI
jgi:hypothetical protein